MVTIKDIAKAAGVSVTTVSRALNGYSDVNEKTRKKISDIARELNYSPNTLARGLVMKRSKSIGIIVSGLTEASRKDNFTLEVLSGVNDVISERDYDLVLFSTTTTKQREKTYSQLCRERRVDGAILHGIKMDDPYLKEVIDSDIPCVLIDIPIETETVGYVSTDNALGAKKAVQFLIDQGHTNIAMMNGHDRAYVSIKRLEGYAEALSEAGLPLKKDWIVDGGFSEEKAQEEAVKLLTQHPDISAIFCASDLMALGVMKAAKELDIDIPTELSVMGYDDILLASYTHPALTTVAQNIYQLGYQSANLLIDMLEEKTQSRACILDTEIAIRETTGKK
ncbi:LacI family DNA-binding transcriptional regulator [Peribacillus kribbensis]|uniref:LacI family DNA-binding transcriptional regulator n=1 Tax=Peribacillus kribbensis TaxID=356658 RepID=UPI00041E5692|nr:LacI family DNA-binding transcriptional regulator [Peribacillus kribbensis]